jgi:ribosomal protein S18 acetylase RimI-like enzyme
MIIRHAELNDLEQIVNVHFLAFSEFFLTSLGRRFLKEYYKIYIKYSHIAFVAENNGVIEGFVVGSNNSTVFYTNLKKEIFCFIFPMLTNLFNFNLLSKISKRVFSLLFKGKVNSSLKSYDKLSELTSIGVILNDQNKGVGSLLLARYEEYCIEKKIKGITLTTDADKNEKVLKFYKKFGYSIDQTFIQDEKRAMYSLVKYFNY